MEESHPPDYELNQGFLLQLISEDLRKNWIDENGSLENIELPVLVQMTEGRNEIGGWKSYKFTDGESEMKRCVFISQQPLPEDYSILKITEISNLTLEIGDCIANFSENSDVQYIFGAIDFDIEVSGEKIGYLLHEVNWNKYINMVEILERQKVISDWDLVETLTMVDPSIKLARLMWQNRSEEFCDVKFTFADDQENVAFAHKTVLMAISDVFDAHFNGEQFRDLNSVPIIDAEFYYFNKFLEFIYAGKVQFTTLNVAFELLYLSKKYLVSPLKELCKRIIGGYWEENHDFTLKIVGLNQKTNDDDIRDELDHLLRFDTRIVLSSPDFLKCSYATVEWILSRKKLYIDEWTLLCALYRWASHKGCNAFCQEIEDGNLTECLHGLLECIRFENIDGFSLQRFFKFPKLNELVQVDELKKSTFDSILEDESRFEEIGHYSKFRSAQPLHSEHFFIEHMVDSDSIIECEGIRKKNLNLCDGSVLGLKLKIIPDVNRLTDEKAVEVCLSFQFLHTVNEKIENSANLYITVTGIQVKLGKAKKMEGFWEDEISIGEHCDVQLFFSDYRDYLSKKIDDMEDSGKSQVLGLTVEICFGPSE